MEPITDKQLKKMSKIFRVTGRTFQSVALDSGLTSIPEHVTELTKEEAKKCLASFSGYLNMSESKGG